MKEVIKMEFSVCYQEIIDTISRTIQANQCNPELMVTVTNAEKPISGDGDLIEVDDNGRMVSGRLGNKLNRIETVITHSSLDDIQKRYIIGLIETTRLSAGQKMLELDSKIAAEIRKKFL